ncbi:hypothetical protein V8F20_006075 [Naviculisporaceae sp. PSN 640]
MRTFVRLLLTLGLAAALVAAESELAHAMELVYYYSKYQTEFAVYGKKADWIAPDCFDQANRRCNFNEFVSYIKFGRIRGGPEIIEENAKFNWQDKNEVLRTVTKMAGLKTGGQLYMSGNVAISRVLPPQKSVNGLYQKLQEFDTLVKNEIDAMSAGDAKNQARAMHLDSTNKLLAAVIQLRKATRDALIYQELIAKFSPTGKFDKVYEYQDPDGKTQRFAPIQWVANEVTLWGRTYKQYNEEKTAEKSPQLRDPVLYKRVTDHIELWEKDGSKGKGEGLIYYNPTRSGTNKSHAHIIKLQQTTSARFRGAPLPGCD